MATSLPNLRVLDRSTAARELDLASELFHRINRIIPEDQKRTSRYWSGQLVRGGVGGKLGWPEDRPLSIERSPSHAQNLTSWSNANEGRELDDGIHQGFSSCSSGRIGRPNSAAIFF
jgi:hypothetical protein